jgi:2',3'-cyclic-nucleotide 2'-phosphodiesterase (5'-nucleotidase family)
MTNTTKQDPKLETQIKEWAYPFAEYSAAVVGSTSVDLDQSTCQKQECTLGNLIADTFLWYRKSATASIINAGGIRANINKGNITMGDVFTVLPFQNSATEVTLSGADLWKSFEGIVSKVNQWNGQKVTSFAQVSGNLQVIYNPDNSAGSQLTHLAINGKSVTSTDQTNYTIVSLDFLASGGDNFWPKQSGYEVLDTQEEVLVAYLEAFSPVNASIDGRITTGTGGGSNRVI